MGKTLFMLDAGGGVVPAGTGSYMRIANVTLTAAGWASALTQTVNVDGVTADRNTCHVIATPDSWSHDAYGEAGVRCTTQADGKLTFLAMEKPEIDLQVNVLIVK